MSFEKHHAISEIIYNILHVHVYIIFFWRKVYGFHQFSEGVYNPEKIQNRPFRKLKKNISFPENMLIYLLYFDV